MTTLYGRVLIDPVSEQIGMDRRRYREWSVRAKLKMIQLSGLRAEKYVRRAVPTPWGLAVRFEMDGLIRDLVRREDAEWMRPLLAARLPWWRQWWCNAKYLLGRQW